MSRIPLLKMFAKLLHAEPNKDWVHEVYVTDCNHETYKILWSTDEEGEPDRDEVQTRFIQKFEDFEKVKEIND